MDIIKALLKEMEQEAETTRKMLSIIPNDKYSWQPHPKSMTIEQLSNHIAELPSWVSMTLTTDELDFAKIPYTPAGISNTAGVLELFEKSFVGGKAELEKATEAELEKPWVLRNGDYIISTSTKAETIRMAFCQTVHHRAQLGVFLRLLDVAIPGSYGPSADEDSSAFKA
ncbi:Uncharacterized damage-inducible protein DinB (forms a four-helix bundle) [Chitinophaga sp. CF118]|uniref:DinB family protein n=1 Tax=Chitinophaga sp. CF118 TaxID=1884367 RepID=UPI0008F10963|nr:DinB family protein [Chitinophaga sp. CF118]SFD17800.1 Uncharacterized damage-inducible protein DinB (forms a four-helix bundle) [Chitinophaga sp. CF118]